MQGSVGCRPACKNCHLQLTVLLQYSCSPPVHTVIQQTYVQQIPMVQSLYWMHRQTTLGNKSTNTLRHIICDLNTSVCISYPLNFHTGGNPTTGNTLLSHGDDLNHKFLFLQVNQKSRVLRALSISLLLAHRHAWLLPLLTQHKTFYNMLDRHTHPLSPAIYSYLIISGRVAWDLP